MTGRRFQMLKKLESKDLLEQVTVLGEEIEATLYNSRFSGYPGCEPKTLSTQRSKLRSKARRRIAILEDRGINLFDIDMNTIETLGLELQLVEDLEYALQFI